MIYIFFLKKNIVIYLGYFTGLSIHHYAVLKIQHTDVQICTDMCSV